MQRVARSGLGLGEAGNSPAPIKAPPDWLPKKERALAAGIFHSGSNVGAISTPIAVPLIVIGMGVGWQGAFLITGAVGFVWLLAWWALGAHGFDPRQAAATHDVDRAMTAVGAALVTGPTRTNVNDLRLILVDG